MQEDTVVVIRKESEADEERMPASICLMRTDIGWGVAIYVGVVKCLDVDTN